MDFLCLWSVCHGPKLDQQQLQQVVKLPGQTRRVQIAVPAIPAQPVNVLHHIGAGWSLLVFTTASYTTDHPLVESAASRATHMHMEAMRDALGEYERVA